jgi:hypothetical protein
MNFGQQVGAAVNVADRIDALSVRSLESSAGRQSGTGKQSLE